ncbi:hypothetical protein BYT27DRAFT_7227531 [Phlegmacium glaucopus]|nr:hypothetical protein BYT27DRAFT_7227531 [Phlegmacium glaucopus]
MPASSFVDPSTLSLASSPSPSYNDDHESGPSRKRPRTTPATNSDERKEARAHRNRIAAQNSRDKRKAQFSYLERRVAELEEENRRLRAGGLVPPPSTLPFGTGFSLIPSDDDRLRTEREKERERENEELKARIRTLEKGWETVMKALAAQGLPTGVPSTSIPSTPAQSTPTPVLTSSTPPTTAATTTITPPPTDSSSKLAYTAFPSPAPSHDTGGDHRAFPSSDVPAAGGFVHAFSNAVHSGSSTQTTAAAMDDKAMEDLFREILASPKSTNAPLLPFAGSSATEMMSIGFGPGVSEAVNEEREKEKEKEGVEGVEQEEEEKTLISIETGTQHNTTDDTTSTTAVNWANEIEMQCILDTVMTMSSSGEDNQLDMGLGMEFVTPETTLGFELGMVGIENFGFDMDFASIVGSAGQSWNTGVF